MSLCIELVYFSQAPQVGMVKSSKGCRYITPFYEDADGYALLNVEDVLVRRSTGRLFSLLTVTVEIKDIYIIKTLQQAAAHATEGGIIEIAVIGDEGQDAIACLLNVPLRQAYEFHIIVTEPFCLARFFQFWTIYLVGV